MKDELLQEAQKKIIEAASQEALDKFAVSPHPIQTEEGTKLASILQIEEDQKGLYPAIEQSLILFFQEIEEEESSVLLITGRKIKSDLTLLRRHSSFDEVCSSFNNFIRCYWGTEELCKSGTDPAKLKRYIMGAVRNRGELDLTITEALKLLQGQIASERQRKDLTEAQRTRLDHLEQLVLNPKLFSSAEFKNGKVIDSPPMHLSDILRSRKAFHSNLSQTDAEGILSGLQQERLWRLNHLHEVYEYLSIDLSQRVATKYFPQTSAWYVGSNSDGSIPLEVEMSQIGETYQVLTLSDSALPTFLERENSRALSPCMHTPFPQDLLDFSRDEMRIPVINDTDHPIDINATVIQDRERRCEAYKNRDLRVPILGRALSKDKAINMIHFSNALQLPICMNLTFNEGGNTLMGLRDGQPCVIIGKDSLAITKALLSQNLGHELSDEEIKMAFAIDYGVSQTHIFFVEQPGDFHLDMNMAVLGDNTIVINDAEAAEPLAQQYLVPILKREKPEMPEPDPKNIEKAKKQAQKDAQAKKVFEDIAARELQEQGFTVHRFSGRFDGVDPTYYQTVPLMNFFNMVTMRTLSNLNVVITLGCPTSDVGYDFQDHFRNMMNSLCPLPIDRIHFLDYSNSRATLRFNGGLSCRTVTAES